MHVHKSQAMCDGVTTYWHTRTHTHTPPLQGLSIMREITPWVRGRGMEVSDNDDGGCFWISGDLQAKNKPKKKDQHMYTCTQN